jgi:hypothetical protein
VMRREAGKKDDGLPFQQGADEQRHVAELRRNGSASCAATCRAT